MKSLQLKYLLLITFGLVLCLRASADENVEEEEAVEEEEEPIKYTITSEAWFELGIKDSKDSNDSFVSMGKIVVGLFGDICPMTVTNFAQLAKGTKRAGKKLGYKDSPVHRVVKDFVVQMGDNKNYDGTGSDSIYGSNFVDENFVLSHRSAGWVSMANYGVDTNGSQFFITLVPCRWLDGHHVVFGRILSGMNIVREIGELKTNKLTTLPKKYVKILSCGLKEVNRYELTEDQLDTPGDIMYY